MQAVRQARQERHGLRWTSDECIQLAVELAHNISFAEIAFRHQRSEKAIRLRCINDAANTVLSGTNVSLESTASRFHVTAEEVHEAVTKIRTKSTIVPTRSGVRWTAEEDAQLVQEINQKLTPATIAVNHNRSVTAINGRITKLLPVTKSFPATNENATLSTSTAPVVKISPVDQIIDLILQIPEGSLSNDDVDSLQELLETLRI